MPAIARIKTLVKRVQEITHELITGEKRRAAKKLKNDIREHAHVRAHTCEECLGSLSNTLNQVTTERKQELIKQFSTLTEELSYLKNKFKTGSDEYDKRLEIIILKARTLKLIAQCEIGLVAEKYAHDRDAIKSLCEDIHELQNIELDYKTLTSRVFVEYRTKLENLENKVEARFNDTDTIHFG